MPRECDELTVKNGDIRCVCIADAYIDSVTELGYNAAELKIAPPGNKKVTLLGFELPAGITREEIFRLRIELYVKAYTGDCFGLWYASPIFNETVVAWAFAESLTKIGEQHSYQFPTTPPSYSPAIYWYGNTLDTLWTHKVGDNIYFGFDGLGGTEATFSSKEGDYPPELVIEVV